MTPQQKAAGLAMAVAVAETIRDLGEVPSGHLYAQLMASTQMTLPTYNILIASLKGAGLVSEKNYLLRWVGPRLQS